MSRFGAVIFDMDGVLVDSEPLHYRAAQAVLAREGEDLPWDVFAEYVGTTSIVTWAGLRTRFGLGESLDEYMRRHDAAVSAVLEEPLQRLPGVTGLIEAVRSRGRRLALASSSQANWIAATLRGLGLDDTFEVIVSGDDVERAKPAPDIYLEASRRLGLSPARCIAIEDSPAGVRAAKAAGMWVVAVRTHYADPAGLAPADALVNTLEEFDLSLFEGNADGG